MTGEPQRSCIGCRKKGNKSAFLRIVRLPKNASGKEKESVFLTDRSGKAMGRGAYLCDNADCLALAIKHHSLERSFRCKLPPELYKQLSEAVSEP